MKRAVSLLIFLFVAGGIFLFTHPSGSEQRHERCMRANDSISMEYRALDAAYNNLLKVKKQPCP